MNVIRYVIAFTLFQLGTLDAALAAAQNELDMTYSSKEIGEAATLQIGPDKRHVMRTHELTAIDGTSFVGATNALCHETRNAA